MKQAIVFDFDGTLITCEYKQKYVLFSILKSLGYREPNYLNDWWNLKRNGYNTENALIRLGINNPHLISNEWKKIIEDFPWNSFDAPFEDSIPILEFIKNVDLYKVYILTARKSKTQVFQTIQRFGFNDFVNDVIVVHPEKVVEEKSNYLKKINPLIYIGDTELDYMASTISETRFVALSRGQRSKDFLKTTGKFQIEQDLKFIKSNRYIGLNVKILNLGF